MNNFLHNLFFFSTPNRFKANEITTLFLGIYSTEWRALGLFFSSENKYICLHTYLSHQFYQMSEQSVCIEASYELNTKIINWKWIDWLLLAHSKIINTTNSLLWVCWALRMLTFVQKIPGRWYSRTHSHICTAMQLHETVISQENLENNEHE